ncbi:unnamed protein product [Caenorhabditis auriculariae]|uniref:Sphingomyelin phosphodiesterase n=1 Tax=Caenorhabditis auriculariae TaxID=2777116 RepID=A0A8S1GRP6_9PELO|nr:unnamed protein product [Caenorhabditis auriculariae]
MLLKVFAALLLFSGTVSALTDCEQCELAVDLLHEAWGDKTTSDCVGDLVTFICETFRIENDFVCKYIISDFKDEFVYVIQQIIVVPHEICGLLMHNTCGNFSNPLLDNWNLPLPPNQPVFVPQQPVKPGNPTKRVLHLTDLHLDMHYTPGFEVDCGSPQCCRPQDLPDEAEAVKNPAGYWGAVGNCDAPYWLYINMLDNIVANNGKLDYIVVSGDLMSHADWDYNNVTHIAKIHNISDELRSRFPDTPIYFTVGNHEGVPIDNITPHFTPKKYHMDWLYAAMADSWKGWVPEDQDKLVRYNGCYMVKLYPGLRIVSLNTVMGDRVNFWLYINQTDPDGTMTWFINQLYDAEKAGDHVHVVAHIPGADGECLQGWGLMYYKVLNRFANTIKAQFFGHTHSEEFYVSYADPYDPKSTPTSVVYSAPSLTPYAEFYPAYRIYTVDGDYTGSTHQVIDFEEWYFNLTTNNANPSNPQWQKLYASANQEYGMQSQAASEWDNLITRMITDDDLFEKYRDNYYRRTSFDGLKKCDEKCKRGFLCAARQLHDSKKLCADLGDFEKLVRPSKQRNFLNKPRFQSRTKDEIAKAYYKFAGNQRNDKCPI